MDNAQSYTFGKLTEITGLSRVSLWRRSKRESWPLEETQGNGGVQFKVIPAILPPGAADIQAAILKYERDQELLAVGPEESPAVAGYLAARNYLEDLEQENEERRQAKERGLAAFNQLPEARKREAEAKYEIIAAKDAFIKAGGYKKSRGLLIFCELYNKGRIDLPDWVIEHGEQDGRINRATIYRWEEAYNTQGLAGLASRRGQHRRGVSKLTEEQKNYVIAMIGEHPDIQMPKLMAGMHARFNSSTPAEHVVYFFVKKYRKEKAPLILYMKNPDAWKSKYQFAVGSASANITALNQLWESDATPGDVMLADGRHTVIAMIDVWSRRPKLLVTPTSKSQAICTLLRWSLMNWGVPLVLRTDNGQDFTALHMERVLSALEIEHDLCAPFTPEQKPHVERFIGTFSHGIVELLPGYIGHNVAERKDIEARQSFAQRLMKKGSIVEVRLDAREFQQICDRWTESVYMHNPHEGLDGKTPAEMVRSWTEPVRKIADERALDVLLYPAPKDNGFRRIGKKGVVVDHRHYFNTAMAGYEGDDVRVLIDHSDLGQAFVFEKSGAFLCVATCPDWYGISAQDAACHLKNAQKQIVSASRKEVKVLIREQKINQVPEEILAYRESLLANVAELPPQETPYSTPAIEEAIIAADRRDGIVNKAALAGPVALPESVLAYEEKQQKVVNLQAKRTERRLFENNKDIYFWILDLIKAETATAAHRSWKKDYEEWLDSGNRRPFRSNISIDELCGVDRKADAGNQL